MTRAHEAFNCPGPTTNDLHLRNANLHLYPKGQIFACTLPPLRLKRFWILGSGTSAPLRNMVGGCPLHEGANQLGDDSGDAAAMLFASGCKRDHIASACAKQFHSFYLPARPVALSFCPSGTCP